MFLLRLKQGKIPTLWYYCSDLQSTTTANKLKLAPEALVGRSTSHSTLPGPSTIVVVHHVDARGQRQTRLRGNRQCGVRKRIYLQGEVVALLQVIRGECEKHSDLMNTNVRECQPTTHYND